MACSVIRMKRSDDDERDDTTSKDVEPVESVIIIYTFPTFPHAVNTPYWKIPGPRRIVLHSPYRECPNFFVYVVVTAPGPCR